MELTQGFPMAFKKQPLETLEYTSGNIVEHDAEVVRLLVRREHGEHRDRRLVEHGARHEAEAERVDVPLHERVDVLRPVGQRARGELLRGGALIMSPLYGADGQIYAMAQGNLAVGGLGVSGQDGSKLTVNVPTFLYIVLKAN